MKKVYVLLTGLILGYYLNAQQLPLFSQYMFNTLYYNPAFAGMNGAICINADHREQWVGFQGRPVTTLISADDAIPLLHGGLGLTIMQDQIGQFTDLDAKLSYAYHKADVGPGKLSIGASLGFDNKKINWADFHPIDAGDDFLTSNSSNGSGMALDFALGAFYQVNNKYYFGLSSQQLFEPLKEKFSNDFTFDLARHYYITGGYHYSLENYGLTGLVLTPSALIQSDGVSMQIDVNAMVDYNNKFWAGITWRKQDAVVIMIGLKPFGPGPYENLKIGYSYDIATSAIGARGRSSGSHEIYVGYCFKIESTKTPGSYHNVRFL